MKRKERTKEEMDKVILAILNMYDALKKIKTKNLHQEVIKRYADFVDFIYFKGDFEGDAWKPPKKTKTR